MAEKVLIDMIKLRSALVENPDLKIPEGYFFQPLNADGHKSIRELAVFRYTCRKCEDAPCIAVCPADALEKDREGLIKRHTNLCISCKSCVTICPFGTMMTDFFHHHINRELFFNLNDAEEMRLFVNACPPGIATIADIDESPEQNIYSLGDNLLVREYLYSSGQ